VANQLRTLVKIVTFLNQTSSLLELILGAFQTACRNQKTERKLGADLAQRLTIEGLDPVHLAAFPGT